MKSCFCLSLVGNSRKVDFNLFSSRARRVTVAPSCASSIADALPMPCVLPQTSARLPIKLRSIRYCLITRTQTTFGLLGNLFFKTIDALLKVVGFIYSFSEFVNCLSKFHV